MPLIQTIASVHYSKVLLYTGSTPSTFSEDVEVLRPLFTPSGSYVELTHLRDIPELGGYSEVTNYPVFGSKTSYPVVGQGVLQPMQFELNFVATMFQAGQPLRLLVDSKRIVAMAVVLLSSKPTGPALVGSQVGAVPHAVYYSWGGILDWTVTASRQDAATCSLTWQPVTAWLGPDQIEPSDT